MRFIGLLLSVEVCVFADGRDSACEALFLESAVRDRTAGDLAQPQCSAGAGHKMGNTVAGQRRIRTGFAAEQSS
jgi:hypothetical protein